MMAIKDNLAREMKVAGNLSQYALAAMSGVPQPTIKRILDGNNPQAETIKKLAEAMNVSSSRLLDDEVREQSEEYVLGTNLAQQEMTVNKDALSKIETRKIPIMNTKQLIEGKKASELNDQNHSEWIERAPSSSPDVYALIMHGNSMTNPSGGRSIPAGFQVIIDPDIEPMAGDIAIIRYGDEIMIKQLETDGPNKNLIALNPQYAPITMTADHKLIGKVIWVGLSL